MTTRLALGGLLALLLFLTAYPLAMLVYGSLHTPPPFLAWIVARTDTPYRDTIEALITLPFYIPPILTAMAWGMPPVTGRPQRRPHCSSAPAPDSGSRTPCSGKCRRP